MPDLLADAGLSLGVSILRGALDRYQVREMAYWDSSQDTWVVVGRQFRPLLEWTLKSYSTGVSLFAELHPLLLPGAGCHSIISSVRDTAAMKCLQHIFQLPWY